MKLMILEDIENLIEEILIIVFPDLNYETGEYYMESMKLHNLLIKELDTWREKVSLKICPCDSVTVGVMGCPQCEDCEEYTECCEICGHIKTCKHYINDLKKIYHESKGLSDKLKKKPITLNLIDELAGDILKVVRPNLDEDTDEHDSFYTELHNFLKEALDPWRGKVQNRKSKYLRIL